MCNNNTTINNMYDMILIPQLPYSPDHAFADILKTIISKVETNCKRSPNSNYRKIKENSIQDMHALPDVQFLDAL